MVSAQSAQGGKGSFGGQPPLLTVFHVHTSQHSHRKRSRMKKFKRTNKHEKFMSSALQATKKSSRALLCNLKSQRVEVGLCLMNHEGLAVEGGHSKSGIADLGHHGDVLGSSKSKCAVHDLSLQSVVLVLLLTSGGVSSIARHCDKIQMCC